MIRIIAELEAGRVEDIQPGRRITGPEIEQEFDDIEYIYGERPQWVRVEWEAAA